MKINKLILLILIIVGFLGLFLRFYKIETIPPHLSNDEISIAYDSYSINRTNKDEHNNYLPLAFQSHGTYKAPGYAYLLAPLYSIFKNTNTTARLPSVILGYLTIVIIGLITFQLTKNKPTSIFSVIILASSPWHIITSRMVLESNLSLFFLALAIFLLLKSVIIKKTTLIYFSVFFFATSMYFYHTEWGLSPLLLFIMLFIFYRKERKKFFIPLLFFSLLIMPLFLNFITNLNTSARANTELIWKGEAVVRSLENRNVLLSPLIISKAIFEKYLENININYLFFNGTELLGKKHIFEQGLFLWPLIIPFFVGLFSLKKIIKKEFFTFFIVFILVSPIIPSFTHGSASLVRNLNTVLPYTIIIAIGLYQIFTKSIIYKSIILSILILVSFFYFSSIYLFHYPLEKAEGFQGYRPIASFLERNLENYQHIYVDHLYGKQCQFIGVPHLYFSYYQSLDPKFLQNRFNDELGDHFDKFIITQIDWNYIKLKKGDLYVVSVCNSPISKVLDKIKLITSFIDINGNPAFELWEVK
jgi:4-amino-4-deoxy-L-arabinose transferase-like glycosyltransferase